MNVRDALKRILGTAALAACAAAGVGNANAAWPERPITLIVPWGAGGGTDATARIIGSLLEKELGQPVNVVNRTGGSGVVGHSAIASRAARRLHDRHHHGRDRHDALAGADRPHGHVVHADRRSSTPIRPGLQVRADAPYKTPTSCVAAIKANPGQVQGVGHRPGRHLAPRDRRHAEGPEGRSGRACRGCRRTAPRPACRISSPAASRSCPCSLPEARSLIDAGKVKSLAVMADKPAGAVSERADAEGGDRQRLDDRRVARHRGAEGPADRSARQARRGDPQDRREQGVHRLHGAAAASASIYAAARRVRAVHGEVRRRPRRDDEGGRHRQVTSRRGASERARLA